jgi:hypothetical protein
LLISLLEQLLTHPELVKVGSEYGLQQHTMTDEANSSFQTNGNNSLLLKTIYTKKVLSEV